jgi:hypothetical protein
MRKEEGSVEMTKDKEMSHMPTIEAVEHERVAYVKEMESYLHRLKNLPDSEAIRQSKLNLEKCHIIRDDGEFTEKYNYSIINADHEG